MFAHGPVDKQRTTDLPLLFSLHGKSLIGPFLSHWLTLAVLGHQLRGLQDTHTSTKGQASSGQKKAGPAGRGGTPLVCVCVQPPALLRQCFWKEQESKLYLTSLWLTMGSFTKTATILFSCLLVNPSRQLCPQELRAQLPWLGPALLSLGLLVARAEASALSIPLFRSHATAHFTGAYFLNWRHKSSVLRNLCNFSLGMTVPA